jgi:coenzyme PQQ biosynthesis protein C
MKRVLNTAKCETQAGKLRMMGWSVKYNFEMRDTPLSESDFIAGLHAIGEGILPATRHAVQAYVDFVPTRPHLEAVASFLTELFSGKLIALRMDALRRHYPWLSSGLDYFTGRPTQAPEDADFALVWIVKHARTRQDQDKAHAALRAKCDILWAQLDALYFAYVNPGWPPPGAFKPIRSTQEGNRDDA